MGTRANPGQRRATKRGLASFVSFLLLFAFALGQSSLSALADDAGTDPVAAEDLLSDGSTVGETLPVAEEAPAAEEEAPAAEEEAPVADSGDGGAAASTDDGSTSTSGSGGASRGQVNTARSNRNTALAAPAAPLAAQELGGGDISLDYVAAGPFTYDHDTGLGTYPTFGYNDRHIDKDDGVVESLESGDFECSDLVTFFTQIVVDDDADSSGTIELDYTFGNETTGQPGLGFTDIVSVATNAPDDADVGNVADNVVTLSNEFIETTGYNQLHGTVTITNLAPGETAIVRLIVRLTCMAGTPTGNILNAIQAGRIVLGGGEFDTIPVGQQTVPMKVTGFVPEPAIDIEKICPPDAFVGEDITFTITITNNGNEPLDNIVVIDTVDGHAPVDISNLFADSLAPGASETQDFVYSQQPGDPDPTTNSVTVTADGVSSNTEVTDTAQCDTDIKHKPGIDVTKSCPESVPFGEAIEYTITVENIGFEPLLGVTVTDTLLGDITGDFDFDFSNPFPVGEVATAVVTYTPQPGDPDPITNTVTATGTGDDSDLEDTDTANCTTDITHVPGIDVTKSCPLTVPAGEAITYTITLQNTGNEPLELVSVNDSLLGPISATAFDPDLPDPLPVGNTIYTATVSYTPVAGDPDPLTNTVTASGTGVDSDLEDTDTANCTTDITHVPGIDVTKSCPLTVPAGEAITYTITLQNTGNEPLELVSVNDSLLGPISATAFDPDLPDPLPVGNTIYTATVSYTPVAGDPDPLTNTVTASGTGVDSDLEDTDTANCTTDITHVPGIDVTKSCPLTVPAGEAITYTITLQNTGNEPLELVSVNDSLLGPISATAFDPDLPDPLPVGNTIYTATVSYTPVAGDPDPLTNTVTASGTGVDSDLEDTDTANCTTDILNPSIGVTKSCTELAHVGDTVTYTITVTNTGDEDLDNVTVNDTILGDLSASFADELAVGASESHDFPYVVQADDDDPLVNEVTAKGSGVGSRVAVEALANCDTDIIHPGIEIVKTVDEETVPIGTTVTYTYVVTNTGDTTLYDISVDDDILGHIGDIEVLEPGQSETLTKDFVVGDEPVTNVGTAEGEDILGRSVSAVDDAIVTPIADVPPEEPPTPFTGSDAGRLGLISMVLFGIGVTVVATTRRRRPEREAA